LSVGFFFSFSFLFFDDEGFVLFVDLNDADMKSALGGEWEVWLRTEEDDTQTSKMNFTKDDALGNPEGHSIRIDYDVDSPNPAYNGIRASLNTLDASEYKFLNLYLKGEPAPGQTQNVKIELIGPDKRPSPYVITGITGEWQKFQLPLSEFMVIQDWKTLEKFVVVFADILNLPKTGTLSIDQVYFSKE
jgi:hypothetical protein